MSHHRMRLALVCVALVGTACGFAPSRDGDTKVVPGLSFRTGDKVLDLDLATDGDRTAYLAWVERRLDRQTRRPGELATRLAVADLQKNKWTILEQSPSTTQRPIRLVYQARELHLFMGSRILHSTSSDNGKTWSHARPVVSEDRFAVNWNVLGSSDGVVVALTQIIGTPGRTVRNDSLRLLVWRESSSSRLEQRVLVGLLPPAGLGEHLLKLLQSGDSLYLFCASMERLEFPKMDPSVYRFGTQLSMARSGDGGRTWSGLSIIKALPDWDSADGELSEICPVSVQGQLALYYAGVTVRVISLRADGSWSTPSVVCPPQQGLFDATSFVPGLATATLGSRGLLVWMDSRFARTDKALGVPMRLQSDWPHTDALARMLPTSPTARCSPLRLTPELSRAERLRVRTGGHNFYVAWTGFGGVGRNFDPAKATPNLYFARLPAK